MYVRYIHAQTLTHTTNARHSQWKTRGSASQLLCELQQALSIAFARLIILDLLSKRHAPSVQQIGPTELLRLLCPLFPFQRQTTPRELFSTGPLRCMRALIDSALVGWFSAHQGCVLVEKLSFLSEQCEEAVRLGVACKVCLSLSVRARLFCMLGAISPDLHVFCACMRAVILRYASMCTCVLSVVCMHARRAVCIQTMHQKRRESAIFGRCIVPSTFNAAQTIYTQKNTDA